MRTLLLFVSAALLVSAKDPLDLPPDTPAALRGPVLGFVFDANAGALRPLTGMPGAAVLAAPLDLGVTLTSAVISPLQDSALGIAGDGHVFLLRPKAGSAVPLDDVRPAPDRVVFSPRGAAAALYHADTGQVEVVRGLPDRPTVETTLDLSPLSGTPAALALADDAGALLAAFSDDNSAAVYAFTRDAAPRLVDTLRHVSALAFLEGTRDALIADDLESTVWLARDATGDNAIALVAGPEDGIAGPAALRASADGATVFVANAETGSIAAIGLNDRQVSSVSCDCTPAALEKLDGGALLRLTEPAPNAPLWLLDIRAASAFFVPAGSQAVQQ